MPWEILDFRNWVPRAWKLQIPGWNLKAGSDAAMNGYGGADAQPGILRFLEWFVCFIGFGECTYALNLRMI